MASRRHFPSRRVWQVVGLVVLIVVAVVAAWAALSGYSLSSHTGSTYAAAPEQAGSSSPTQAASASSTGTPSVAASSSGTSSAAHPVAVFVGDSYTSGAVTTGVRWTTLLSRAMGWQEVNLALGGTGYETSTTSAASGGMCTRSQCPSYAGMIPEIVQAHPNIVVVSGGRNDGAADPTAITGLFTSLHTQLPDATIYAINPLWDDSTPPSWLEVQSQDVQKAVTSVKGTFVDIGQPLEGRSDRVIPGTVLPNTQGHQAIAADIEAKLKG